MIVIKSFRIFICFSQLSIIDICVHKRPKMFNCVKRAQYASETTQIVSSILQQRNTGATGLLIIQEAPFFNITGVKAVKTRFGIGAAT
jgi:hypothetical protein